jgi:hypothetical protein
VSALLCACLYRYNYRPWEGESRAGFAVMASAVAVGGCAAQIQAKKMDTALTPYVGKSIADYALDRGPPTNTIDMGGNKRGFQWVITGQSPAAVVPLNGALIAVPSHQQTCTVSLVASTTKPSPALSDWIIESWRWNGDC